MLQTLKIKTLGKFNVWLTSDTHFGHNKSFLFEPRGFKDIESHDIALLAKINELIQPNDVLLFCGDFSLNTSIEQFKSYCARINCCNIIFVAGNHNSPWWKFYKELVQEKYGESIEVYPFTWNNITFVGESVDVEVDGFNFHLGHFPKLIWDKQHHGRVMGCGHSHGTCKKTLPNNKMGKIVDLGWDVFGRPIDIKEFKKIVDSKEVERQDHHSKETT